MTLSSTLSPPAGTAKCQRLQTSLLRMSLVSALVLGLGSVSTPARAVDGCVVLLCFAAPSWRAIAQCVPPIRQVLRDLARGRAFPVCGMGGPGNNSAHRFSHAPGYCPAQYVRERIGPNGPIYYCEYTGAISVNVNGQLFTRTWWHMNGDAVTEFTPEARSQLGSWDPRFDDEFAHWQANPHPAPPLPIP